MKQRKQPEPLIDGMCDIYTVKDTTEPGEKLQEQAVFMCRLPYARRIVGVQRQLVAMQEHATIDLRIRCPFFRSVEVNNIVVLANEPDEAQYKINKIESPAGLKPRVMDINLERMATRYETVRLD